jgi:hypothetical protein
MWDKASFASDIKSEDMMRTGQLRGNILREEPRSERAVWASNRLLLHVPEEVCEKGEDGGVVAIHLNAERADGQN